MNGTTEVILDLVPLAIIECKPISPTIWTSRGFKPPGSTAVLIIRTHALYQSRAILFSLSSLAVVRVVFTVRLGAYM